MDTAAYLERIGYPGPLAPTADTLRDLHVAHLRTIPFENLSLSWREPVVLAEDALFQKIVTRRRGGFCYELNGLFAALLRHLGFGVALLEGGVMSPRGTFGPPFDHMVLMVTLADRWLVDVGFGDSFLEPLRLDERGPQVQGTRAYRVIEDGEHLVLQHSDDGSGTWVSHYRFRLGTHALADYDAMCHHHQTSPESIFTQRRICSRATADGRVTIADSRLIVTAGASREVRELLSDVEFSEALRDHFGIVPPTLP